MFLDLTTQWYTVYIYIYKYESLTPSINCYTHPLNVSIVMKLKTRQDLVTLRTIPLFTLCYHGTLQYSKWKPALALLITRNALSQCPSKTCVLKSRLSRRHMWAVCSPCPTGVPTLRFQGKGQTICADLFELASRCGGRRISKGRGCVQMGRKGWRTKSIFELPSTGAVLEPHCS